MQGRPTFAHINNNSTIYSCLASNGKQCSEIPPPPVRKYPNPLYVLCLKGSNIPRPPLHVFYVSLCNMGLHLIPVAYIQVKIIFYHYNKTY